MPTITVTPSTGNDDGWAQITDYDGIVDVIFPTGSGARIGVLSGDDEEYQFYARFALSIPAGATIDSATITLTRLFLGNAVDTLVAFVAEDNAAAPTTAGEATADIANLSSTVAWTVPGNTSGSWTSPDISVPLQEIIDRFGWASGNSVLLYIINNDTGTNRAFPRTYESGTTGRPELSVTYTDPVIEIVDSQTNIETSGLSDDNTVTKPTGTAEGDLLLTAVGLDGSDSSFGAPSGFTKDYGLTSGSSSLVSAHKTAGASEPSTYTWSGWNNESSVAGILAIRNHNGIDASNSNTNSGSSIGVSVTTTVDDCLLVVFVNSEDGSATWTAPDGTWTEQWDLNTSGSSTGSGLACFTKIQASAGSAGTLTFTCSDDNDNCIAIYAIAPDGGTAYTLAVDGGSYAVTGTATSLLAGKLAGANGGSYAITGQDSSLEVSRALAADSGSYAITGQDVTLLYLRALVAEGSTYGITGTDANLEAHRVLTAQSGSYAISGQDAALSKGRILTAETGSYSISGQDAALQATRALSAETGSYSINGQDATLSKSLFLAAEGGTYSISGQNVGLSKQRVLIAEGGTYLLDGQDVVLTYTEVEQPASQEEASGGWFMEPPKWRVKTDRGWREFSTAEEAYNYAYPEDAPRRIKRLKELQPKVTYAGKDIAELRVDDTPGDLAFSYEDTIARRAMQRKLEILIEQLIEEEEAVALLLLM